MKACSFNIIKIGLLGMAIVALLLGALNPVVNATADQKSPVPQNAAAPSPAVPSAIPVADVATQATEVATLLQVLAQSLAPDSQVEMIGVSLPDVLHQYEHDEVETTNVLRRQPSLSILQTQREQWQKMRLKTMEWLTALTKRSNELQDALNRLTELQKLWMATFNDAKASKAPETILRQIDQTITAIKVAQAPLKEQLTSVLDLQSEVSDEVARCGKVLAEIARIQRIAMVGTLKRDSLPLWSRDLWDKTLPTMPDRIREIAASNWIEISNYIKDTSGSMPLHAGLFIFLTLLFLLARNKIRRSDIISSGLRVFDTPIASSLNLTLFIITSPTLGHWVGTVRDIFQVVAFLPVIILLRPLVRGHLRLGMYLFALLSTIDTVREVFAGEMLTGQCVLVMESLAGIALIIWVLRNSLPSLKDESALTRSRAFQAVAGFVLMVCLAGLTAAALGYTSLARLLTPGMIASGTLALTLYSFVLVSYGVTAFAFRIWPLRTLRMVSHHQDILERKIYRYLIAAAAVSLIIRYLSYVGLLEASLSFMESILNAKFERGALSISSGDVLMFVITVWAAYLLSAFIRFMLKEDVYPRIGIATGKAYAISSLLHYLVLALGYTVAIAAMGVNLTKLTVLTGAFGVGIGFGLQSVVNNFVSGLILLFERPIHVGDTVEVGDLLGKVKSIGIRASTVYTRQGADIIVPNSQLITDKVTNWTLSDQLRRIDLPLGVNYGAVPTDVIALLQKVAMANPCILDDPAPQGLLMGYGDSTINFELRAWTDRFDDWPRVRSELAIAVYDAVYAAGMTFAFPQREVRLLHDKEGGSAAQGANSVDAQ